MRLWPRVGCLLQSSCVYLRSQVIEFQWIAFIFIFFEDFPCFVGNALAMSRQLHDATPQPTPTNQKAMKTIEYTATIATFHILHRTGGVYDSFRGTLPEAIAEVAHRNGTDEHGTTELVSSFSDETEGLQELAFYMGEIA